MASSSSSHLIPSRSSFKSLRYEVFLSFRGEDMLKTFVDHLYTSLLQQGIHTYKDDETLPPSESIRPSLLKAIAESRIAVIVFSKNNADSSWRLDDLANIIECMTTRGQIVMPVFYHVNSLDVINLRGKYGTEAFLKHELKNDHKVKLWKNALATAFSLSGQVPTYGDEAEFIKLFVGSISSELYRMNSKVSKALIGIKTRLQYTMSPNGTFGGSFKNWRKGKFLGSGSFGAVHEALDDESGCFFAVKEVSLRDQGSQENPSKVHLEQEISLLSQFYHENIVRYLGTDSGDGKLYIFLELVTMGSLAKLYKEYELQDSQVSAYTRQILSGLNYLHERNVVHRDIKCANILVDASGSVKLADFGLAKVTTLNDIKSCKGTAHWMAPEVVDNRAKQGYGLAADIWSLGCTVLEMLTRKIPYYPLEWQQAMFKIGWGELPEIPNTLSAEAQDFIRKCLQRNPNDRPTAGELLEHPFLKRPTYMNLALPSPHHNSPQL